MQLSDYITQLQFLLHDQANADFSQQELINAISEWERSNPLDDPSWNYYEQWLTALERVVVREQLLKHDELVGAASGSLRAG